MDIYFEKLQELAAVYSPKILGALVTLILGWIIIGRIRALLPRFFDRMKLDATIKPFLTAVASVSLKVLVVVIALNILSSQAIASLVALIGAAGLAIGLALQGTLTNLAGGVIILILRPFQVGDFITAAGHSGTVEMIHIFNTILVTPDNKVINIPNGSLSNTDVINYSIKETRRVDLTFGVSYDADIDTVKTILTSVIDAHELILRDPEPFIRLAEHGDSAVVFVIRVWTNKADYWTVHFDLQETVMKEFNKANIGIPYPQMDIHFEKE